MSEDQEAGRSPPAAGTLRYSPVVVPITRRASTLPYEPEPHGYPSVNRYGNEDRPLSTRESWEQYRALERMIDTICGPRAYFKGWDRIQENYVPLQRCPCCRQKIRNRRNTSVPSYVIGDREYGMVDSVLARVYSEMRGAAVSSRDRQRHLSNTFHILVENEDLLQRSLKIVTYRKCRRAIDVLHSLFNGNVPESEVQTQ